MMIEEAVYTVIIERDEMKGIQLGLMCDKGESKKKRNGASFVKLVPRFDGKKDKVKVTCIGIYSAVNFSVDVAQGVDHALIPYHTKNNRLKLSVQGTDAGGDGTRKDLADKLEMDYRVENYNEYAYSTCSLHGIIITISSPTQLIMSEGSLLKRNALQCMSIAYNLAQQYHTTECKDIWIVITGANYEAMKMPVMSRWEWLGIL